MKNNHLTFYTILMLAILLLSWMVLSLAENLHSVLKLNGMMIEQDRITNERLDRVEREVFGPTYHYGDDLRLDIEPTIEGQVMIN